MTTTVPPLDGITIRKAEYADLLDVLRIEKQSFPQPWPYQIFSQFIGQDGFLVAIDVNESVLVGYVVADVVPNHGRPLGHIKDIAVDPEWRNQGIGTRLINRALSSLATSGVTRVKLEVREGNEPALELYTRFGFEPHHTVARYYDDGEDALVLVTNLTEDSSSIEP